MLDKLGPGTWCSSSRWLGVTLHLGPPGWVPLWAGGDRAVGEGTVVPTAGGVWSGHQAASAAIAGGWCGSLSGVASGRSPRVSTRLIDCSDM